MHKQFYDRKAEWYDDAEQGTRLVMWWVPEAHIPTVAEAVERLAHLGEHGQAITRLTGPMWATRERRLVAQP